MKNKTVDTLDTIEKNLKTEYTRGMIGVADVRDIILDEMLLRPSLLPPEVKTMKETYAILDAMMNRITE